MTSNLRKAVCNQFEKALSARFPQFRACPTRSALPDIQLYRWDMAGDLACYVVLSFSPKQNEAFTLELAWTTRPDWSSNATMTLGPDHAPKEGLVWFRICELFEKRPQFDPWWDFAPPGPDWSSLDWASASLREEGYLVRNPAQLNYQMPRGIIHANAGQRGAFVESARPLVPLAVEQALDKIEQYALPYFEQIKKEHGRSKPGIMR